MGSSIDKYLVNAGIDEYYLSYMSRCYSAEPKKKTGKSGNKSHKCCYPFTISLIRKMQPKVIIALGANVLEMLTNTSLNIDVVHGMPFYHRELNLYVIPTYSLSFLASTCSSANKKADLLFMDWFKADLKSAYNVLNQPSVRQSFPTVKSLTNPVDIEKYLTKLLSVEDFAWDIETAVS